MLIKMDILKVTQASAFLIKKHGGFIGRKRLLKLLYIADRELIKEAKRPLTGDKPIAMDHGPVLSHTYDLLKGTATGIETWNKYIDQAGPFTHRLVADPGVGKLSKIELKKLDELVERYWTTDDDDLSTLTHSFPEWERNKPGPKRANPIATEHVLEAMGMANEIESLRSETRDEAELDHLLSGASQ